MILQVIEINNTKIANLLIKKRLVLEYILYKFIKYNLIYKIYKYAYDLVYS